ncbi:MAG: zf-TFIIB domain-containing protein [Pseudooceanicola sp.]|nr:zf-TFIIB domain-containing protein [Pseudooceanicola sp.]MCB1356224.1 zf-TFIIB domain-containing protein [Maritimibacter sp.]
MQCPVERTDRTMTERSRVGIDDCPKCRGVWLDRGEFDKIVERGPAEAAAASRTAPPPTRRRDRPREAYRDERDEATRYGRPDWKRRKGFLSDIFDVGWLSRIPCSPWQKTDPRSESCAACRRSRSGSRAERSARPAPRSARTSPPCRTHPHPPPAAPGPPSPGSPAGSHCPEPARHTASRPPSRPHRRPQRTCARSAPRFPAAPLPRRPRRRSSAACSARRDSNTPPPPPYRPGP